MITVLRRFLVLLAVLFWQGGFTFYSGVVVPVGQGVLNSHLEQGLITRQVTKYLNLAGAAALLVVVLDLVAARETAWVRRLRWLLWLGMLVTLVALVWLHPQIDQYLDPEQRALIDARAFRRGHRVYLWVSTVQWGFGVAYLWLTLRAWREVDHVRQV